jgi:hypothetical protein
MKVIDKSVVAGVAVLTVIGWGCGGGREAAARAEEQKREVERAAGLAESLKKYTANVNVAEARKDFEVMRQRLPKDRHARVAKLEGCQVDGIEQVQKAAAQEGYDTIATVAVGCVTSMQALFIEERTAMLRAVLAGSGQGAGDTQLSLLKVLGSTRDAHTELLTLLVDRGPRKAREAAFGAIAQELSRTAEVQGAGDILKPLLQRAHAAEQLAEPKARMAAKLNELGVPLEVPSPPGSSSARPSTE